MICIDGHKQPNIYLWYISLYQFKFEDLIYVLTMPYHYIKDGGS